MKFCLSISKSILFTGIFLYCCMGCSSDDSTSSNNSSLVTGNVNMDFDSGFDFSSEQIIEPSEDSLAFIHDVSLMDIYIYASKAPTEPGQPESPWEFGLIGSPIGKVTTNPFAAGSIVAYEKLPNDTMPAILKVNATHLDDVSEIPDSGFRFSLDELSRGIVYGVKTQDSKYAIFEITGIDTLSVSDTANVTFKWKYQKDGSTSFK